MGELISGARRLSSEALTERAARAASGLRSLGIGRGDLVALYLRNDFPFFEASAAAGLVGAYPTLADEYPSHEAHLATIEASLRELAASGTPNLGIVTGTVPSYEAFAASEATSPGDADLLPQYATTLAARGRAVG